MGGRPERGLFQIIFKHLINSLKPRRFTGDLIGSDHLGNKYYETPRSSTSEKKRSSRYFEPQSKDNFEQELPAEWEAWLRYRRKEPPSESEVLHNVALMNLKKKNAAELESAANNLRPLKKDVQEAPAGMNFPTYKEYQSKGSKD